VLRSQAMSFRQRDFVSALIVSGEPRWRIVFREILPNMTSLIASGFIGLTLYAIGTVGGLQFLGLGNLSEVNWFTILYWAQNSDALQTGAWWTFVFPGVAMVLVGLSCAMINFGIDEVSNPRLRDTRPKTVRRRRWRKGQTKLAGKDVAS
jgi:peptide/nickel transport system permease protein